MLKQTTLEELALKRFELRRRHLAAIGCDAVVDLSPQSGEPLDGASAHHRGREFFLERGQSEFQFPDVLRRFHDALRESPKRSSNFFEILGENLFGRCFAALAAVAEEFGIAEQIAAKIFGRKGSSAADGWSVKRRSPPGIGDPGRLQLFSRLEYRLSAVG